MSCRCASGYGANLLGKCVPAAGPLQAHMVAMVLMDFDIFLTGFLAG